MTGEDARRRFAGRAVALHMLPCHCREGNRSLWLGGEGDTTGKPAALAVGPLPDTIRKKYSLSSFYLDERARGMGGQVSSAGEENVRCLTRDRYRGESILGHEFAHTILNFGIIHVHPGFRKELETAFANAGTNADEYWAEGVQGYFDTNLESDPPNGIHNHVNTREELRTYDPRLYALIHRIFKETHWRYACAGRQPR